MPRSTRRILEGTLVDVTKPLTAFKVQSRRIPNRPNGFLPPMRTGIEGTSVLHAGGRDFFPFLRTSCCCCPRLPQQSNSRLAAREVRTTWDVVGEGPRVRDTDSSATCSLRSQSEIHLSASCHGFKRSKQFSWLKASALMPSYTFHMVY